MVKESKERNSARPQDVNHAGENILSLVRLHEMKTAKCNTPNTTLQAFSVQVVVLSKLDPGPFIDFLKGHVNLEC